MDLTQKLSEHFILSEFTRSDVATRMGIENIPDETQLRNLKLVCEKVLEPVRAHFGKPVRVNSGFRSMALNMVVNPLTTTVTRLSKHCLGQAVDFEIDGVSNYEVACWVRDNIPEFHQVILEFYVPGQLNSGWVHVSYVKDELKKECLTASRVGKKLVYTPGLNQ